jgi:NAD(P)H-nitrite reductase large subunit
MRYAIIGPGPTGVVAAETLRAQDPDGQIDLYGDEQEPAYSRMAIPYLLAGEIEESGTYLRHKPGHFDEIGVRHIRDAVTQIDSGRRQLTLASGATGSYDRLLIATGSRPVKPPVEGLDQPFIHHCWTLEDARSIAREAEAGTRVVLLGAGFIGSIIMEALVHRKVKLTVVERGDRMVPRMMDQVSGNLIKQWCIGHGVDVKTSTTINAVRPDPTGAARYVLATDHGDIQADLVVVAAGIRPTVDFLEGSGVAIRNGVRVNEYLETTVPGIYAAGDVCEGLDWNTGHHAIHAIQPVAVEMARLAALNMTGTQALYTGSLAMNVLDTLGLIAASYGQWEGVEGGDEAELLDAPEYRYIKLQFDGDCLVGAITLGLTQHVGVLRGLIQSRVRLGDWKLMLMRDPSRIMEAYLACTQ